MIERRHISSLGLTDLAWIRARHHFRFAGAQSVDLINWQRVRAINHNILAAGAATTPVTHHGTEVFYFVESGAIDLVRDGGNTARVTAGQILSIYTGSGIDFSIASAGGNEASFTEIWLTRDAPHQPAVVRRLCQSRPRETQMIAAPGRGVASFSLNCPATVKRYFVGQGETVEIQIAADHAYAFLQSGALIHQSTRFSQFDGMAIHRERVLVISGESDCGIVLIEMFA